MQRLGHRQLVQQHGCQWGVGGSAMQRLEQKPIRPGRQVFGKVAQATWQSSKWMEAATRTKLAKPIGWQHLQRLTRAETGEANRSETWAGPSGAILSATVEDLRGGD